MFICTLCCMGYYYITRLLSGKFFVPKKISPGPWAPLPPPLPPQLRHCPEKSQNLNRGSTETTWSVPGLEDFNSALKTALGPSGDYTKTLETTGKLSGDHSDTVFEDSGLADCPKTSQSLRGGHLESARTRKAAQRRLEDCPETFRRPLELCLDSKTWRLLRDHQ